MPFTLLILGLLLLVTPVTIIFDDNLIVQGVVAAIAATSVAVAAVRIPHEEADFLSAVIRPVVLVAFIPAIWMVVQVMPLQGIELANPIWQSAAAALGKPLAGSISVDPGVTLISLARYLSVIAIAFVAAAAAVDRQRAEWILFALVATTALISLMALAAKLGLISSLVEDERASITAIDCAGLGVIFAAAAAYHMSEQSNRRRSTRTSPLSRSAPAFTFCVAALAICVIVVVLNAEIQGYLAIICGVAAFTIAVIIRRLGLGAWAIAAIVSLAVLFTTAIIAFQVKNRSVDLTLAFAMHSSESAIAIAQRLLVEAGWSGTGAGTFAAILPIYRGIGEIATGDSAPTAAAAISVEMGRPFFWATMMAAIALVVAFMRGALRRQRDSAYSIAGASCIVATALQSFDNSAFLSTSVSMIAAVAIGTAIAQSRSRLG